MNAKPDPKQVEREMRNWEPTRPALEVATLPKRECLELVKPVLRLHDAMPSKGIGGRPDEPGAEMREHPNAKKLWHWIYIALGEGLHGSGLLGQARLEVECEGLFGHYWEPADGQVSLIEDGPYKYLAEVYYPRSIRRGGNHWTSGDQSRFFTLGGAQRWVHRRQRDYERYILRLLREGVYDQDPYDR